MMEYLGITIVALLPWLASAQEGMPGAASFVVPTAFPVSVYSTYYVKAAPTSEPQPALFDPILNITYPFNLTNPKSIPTANNDPVYYPEPVVVLDSNTSRALLEAAIKDVEAIIFGDSDIGGNCSKCIAALDIGKIVAQAAPDYVPAALLSLCHQTHFQSNMTRFQPNVSCEAQYSAASYGAVWSQVLSLADVTGLDGRYICNFLSDSFCPAPTVSSLDVTTLFPKPKPPNATTPEPSGATVKVIHLSDFHLDPRYQVGSEANCSESMCCRHSAMASPHPISFPAPLYGDYR